MSRIAVISAVLDEPEKCQQDFNSILANFKGIIKGRMGIPFDKERVSAFPCIVHRKTIKDSLVGIPYSLQNHRVTVKSFIDNI